MRLDYPATGRNRQPILEVLRRVAPPTPRVLEVASGSGQHAAFLAPRLDVQWWQPTDREDEVLSSIDAWAEDARIRPAQRLDVLGEWPTIEVDLMLCVNMIHISPWRCTQALMRGAARTLRPGGVLYLYGPYKREGRHTAPSNERFDASLRSRDPEWGVRDLEAVVAEARGFSLSEVVAMPANNFSVVMVKEVSRQTD